MWGLNCTPEDETLADKQALAALLPTGSHGRNSTGGNACKCGHCPPEIVVGMEDDSADLCTGEHASGDSDSSVEGVGPIIVLRILDGMPSSLSWRIHVLGRFRVHAFTVTS